MRVKRSTSLFIAVFFAFMAMPLSGQLLDFPPIGDMDVAINDQNRPVYDKLFDLRSARKLSEAVDLLDQSIISSPNDPQLFLWRARYRSDLGQHANAITDVNYAVSLIPNNPAVYLSRARIFADANNQASVIKDVNTAISFEPVTLKTFNLAMKELFLAKAFDEEIRIANKFAGRHDFAYDVNRVKYEAKFELKDYLGSLNDAIRALKAVSVVSPGDENYEFRRRRYGNAREFTYINTLLASQLKDNKNVLRSYDSLIQLFEEIDRDIRTRPNSVPSRQPPRSLPLATGTTIDFNEGAVSSHLAFVLQSYATRLEDSGQLKRAEKVLEKLVGVTPTWQGLRIRARFFEKHDRVTEAIADLTKAIAYADDSPGRFQMETLLARSGTPNYRTWRSLTVAWRGDLYFQAKDYESAISDYEAAASENPYLKEKLDAKIGAARKLLN